MDSNHIAVVLAFIFGGGIGFGIAKLLDRGKLSDYKNRINRMNDAVKRYDKQVFDMAKRTDGYRDRLDKALNECMELQRRNKPDISELAKKYEPDEHPQDDDGFREPFEITKSEFNNEYETAVEITIVYRKEENLLVYMSGMLVDEPERLLGNAILEKLPNEKRAFIYVHNDEFDTNYRIHIDRNSYSTEYYDEDEIDEEDD